MFSYLLGWVESGAYPLLSCGSTDNELRQRGLKWPEGEKGRNSLCSTQGNEPKQEAAREIQTCEKMGSWEHYSHRI